MVFQRIVNHQFVGKSEKTLLERTDPGASEANFFNGPGDVVYRYLIAHRKGFVQKKW